MTEVVNKICVRCGTTAGLSRAEIAAGYKCLRCNGFYKDFVPLEQIMQAEMKL